MIKSEMNIITLICSVKTCSCILPCSSYHFYRTLFIRVDAHESERKKKPNKNDEKQHCERKANRREEKNQLGNKKPTHTRPESGGSAAYHQLK